MVLLLGVYLMLGKTAASGRCPKNPHYCPSKVTAETNGFQFSVFTSSANHSVTSCAPQTEVNAILEVSTPTVVEILHWRLMKITPLAAWELDKNLPIVLSNRLFPRVLMCLFVCFCLICWQGLWDCHFPVLKFGLSWITQPTLQLWRAITERLR